MEVEGLGFTRHNMEVEGLGFRAEVVLTVSPYCPHVVILYYNRPEDHSPVVKAPVLHEPLEIP